MVQPIRGRELGRGFDCAETEEISTRACWGREGWQAIVKKSKAEINGDVEIPTEELDLLSKMTACNLSEAGKKYNECSCFYSFIYKSHINYMYTVEDKLLLSELSLRVNLCK